MMQIIIAEEITAIGTNLRLMKICVDGEKYTIRISEKLYTSLRKKGVTTSQKRRWMKEKEKNTKSLQDILKEKD